MPELTFSGTDLCRTEPNRRGEEPDRQIRACCPRNGTSRSRWHQPKRTPCFPGWRAWPGVDQPDTPQHHWPKGSPPPSLLGRILLSLPGDWRSGENVLGSATAQGRKGLPACFGVAKSHLLEHFSAQSCTRLVPSLSSCTCQTLPQMGCQAHLRRCCWRKQHC